MTDFRIVVTIDPSGAKRGGKSVENSLRGIEKKQKDVKKSSSGLATALKAVAASLAVREVVQAASTYQDLQNKLRLVTTGTENLADITEELFAVAQRTRGSYEGTVDLYSRVARSVTELGVSQRETLGFTEAVSQAIAISGATAAEASAGILQLGQGLASGAIRGDELRSVMEQLPGLSREIAAGLGVSIGQLRTLGAEGALTAEAVFGAIQSRAEEIDKQFAELTPTIGQAFQVLKNSGLSAIGTLSSMTGLGDGLSSIIIDLAGGVDQLAKAITGTLGPGDELSEIMVNVSIGVIAAGAALQGLLGILGVVKGAFVDFGEGLGGILAAGGAAFEGDFAQAGRVLSEVFSDGLDDSKAAATDFFEDFSSVVDNASLKINDVLLPSFRGIQEEISTITDGNANLNLDLGAAGAAQALERLREKQAEFITDTTRVNEALRIAAKTGRDFSDVLEDLELGVLSGGDEVWLAEAQALLDAKRAGEDYIETLEDIADAKSENADFLTELKEENGALQIAIDTGRELSDVLEEIAIRKRFAATGDGAGLAEALDLQEANIKLREQLDEADDDIDDFLKRARENSQDLLGGFLAGAFTDGIDDIPRQFANMLLELASQALASEIFKLLGGIGGGASGGQGFLSAIGGFFGGAADGADVKKGDFGIVGEKGPELFQAPANGTIVPNQSAAAVAPQVNVPVNIVNTIDPSDITGAFNGGGGDKVLLNRISAKRNAFRSALGV